jgi:glutamate mutase epsilon subunit
MLKDCGLVAEHSILPTEELLGKARQIYIVEIDLLFKQVCKMVSNTKQAYGQVGNVIQDYSILETNRAKFLRHHIHGNSQRDIEIFSSLVSPNNSRPKSGMHR